MVVELDSIQLFNNATTYTGASIDTTQRWIKEIFPDYNIIDFYRYNSLTVSITKAKTVNIDVDEIIFNFFRILQQNRLKSIVPDETEYNRISYNGMII